MYYHWRSHQNTLSSTLPTVIGLLGLFFVLLVVFLICSQKVSMPGAKIELPQFANEEVTPVVRTIVTVTAEGKLFYNAKLLNNAEELQTALKGREHTSERQVVFYADKNVPLETMAMLFDIARSLNFDAYLATSGESLRAAKNEVPHDDASTL